VRRRENEQRQRNNNIRRKIGKANYLSKIADEIIEVCDKPEYRAKLLNRKNNKQTKHIMKRTAIVSILEKLLKNVSKNHSEGVLLKRSNGHINVNLGHSGVRMTNMSGNRG